MTAAGLAQTLRSAVERGFASLESIGEEQAAARPPRPGAWSRKEELGHLIDSATMNRVRIAAAVTEDGFEGLSYNQDACVRLLGYQDLPWRTLVDFWRASNMMLARAVSRIPDGRLAARCVIGTHEPMTLAALIEDYVAHMRRHLDHIGMSA